MADTRLLDARTLFAFFACGITPAMAAAGVGVGSQYAYTAEDATGAWLDGSRNYTLTLPAGIPAKNFWAIDIYDPQTRSLLRTATPWPSISSHDDITTQDNGDTIIRFGPAAPAGPRTGSRPCPAKAGSPPCASTGHSSPGSTRPGDPARSSPPPDPLIWLGSGRGIYAG